MYYMKECATLTQKYLLEVHNRSLTIDQILDKPRWEQVYMHWKTKEHYEGFVIPMSKGDCELIYGK